MAPRGASRARDFDYSNLGKAGRRTGITLREGAIDEDGMENLEGMFSSSPSPEPEPEDERVQEQEQEQRGRPVNGNATVIASEDMEMAGSSAPDPEDLLDRQPDRARQAHGRQEGAARPPPRAQLHSTSLAHVQTAAAAHSPMRTLLAASPRRTPIVFSSPNGNSNGNGNGRLSSPISARMVQATRTSANARRLSAQRASIGLQQQQQQQQYRQQQQQQQQLSSIRREPPRRLLATSVSPARELEPQPVPEHESDAEELVPPAATRYDRRDIAHFSDDDDGNDGGVTDYDAAGDYPPDDEYAGNAGQQDYDAPDQGHINDHAPEEDHTVPRGATEEPERTTAVPLRSNRKAKAQSQQNRPTGRRRLPQGDKSDDEQPEPEPAHRSKRAKPTTSRGARPPRAQPHRLDDLPAGLDSIVENYASTRPGHGKPRSLYILRREEPEATAQRTRSGRISVRPLAYWRNERCVYGEGEVEPGERYPVSTIKEIIRTEEPEGETTGGRAGKTRGKGTGGRGRKGGRRHDPDDASDDDYAMPSHADPWETEGGGVFYGPVKGWNQDEQRANPEEEVIDIAYAPVAVQTQPVKNASFSFAKILSTPFLGSGFVDMPPQSTKRTKNAKKMHMVFYMIHGRIQVQVAELQFSAGKGTVFQVPRGNDYSFRNTLDKPAKLFFTQGCVVTNEASAGAPGMASSAGPSSEVPTSRPTSASIAAPADPGLASSRTKAGGKKPAAKRRGRPPKQSKNK
ncbi:hypothetical protein KEM52_005676 [Ascosphaera acerosa]|nr:hypothetical protein KEM52_005676 [Ascosphaera acerosa]